MASQDVTHEALAIMRDSLQPKMQRLLDHAGHIEVNMLIDGRVLEPGEGIDSLQLHDPIVVLNVLQNLRPWRSMLFLNVGDEYVLERVKTVRHLRNAWAHFNPSYNASGVSRQITALRWLLEKSNDPAACRRLDELVSATPQQRGRSKRAVATMEEINRRAHKIADDERNNSKKAEELETLAKSLADRESKLKLDEEGVAERRRLSETERTEIARRFSAIEQREKSLEGTPAPEDLIERERNVAAEEVVIAQLRNEYETQISSLDQRRNDLTEREADFERRSDDLAAQEAELEQQRSTTNELAERLQASTSRLDMMLKQLDRQPRAAPAPPPEPQVETRQPQKTAGGDPARQCRRADCDGVMQKREGKYGEFLGCSNYPNCRFTEEVPSDLSEPPIDYGQCPDCSNPLQRRRGYSGDFLGCSNYPRCRYSQSLDEDSGSAVGAAPIGTGPSDNAST